MLALEFNGFRQTLLLNNEPFVLNDNTAILSVPMGLQANLKWVKEMELAKKIQAEKRYIIWDFGLSPPQDEAEFLSYQLAVEHFKEYLFPLFTSNSLGAIVYKGRWDSTKKEQLHFFKSLLPSFPETLTPLLFLENSTLSRADFYYHFSPEHFDGFLVATEDPSGFPYMGREWATLSNQRIPKAIVIPSLEIEDKSVWEEVAEVIDQFPKPFRLIPEPFLTQEWHGVEQLYLFPHFTTAFGKRAVQGFLATGGELITLHKNVERN